MNDIEYKISNEDLRGLILGKKLGSGIHRDVFEYKQDNNLVIKCSIEYPNINILEFEVWLMVKDTQISKWFAPCIDISPCGMYLIQKKIEIRPESEYPKLVPSFFDDLKYSNYGWIKDKFVCCDYAGFIASSMSHKWSGKLKKVEWWE